MYTACIGRL
ncbi:hypothetical protein D030_1608A, partial [Vibrio parahaemolyticus AQ3810]